MKRLVKLWPVAALSILALAFPVQAEEGASPGVGDKAPDFTLMGSDGNEYTLSEVIGDQGVVLAWFPMAFTPG